MSRMKDEQHLTKNRLCGGFRHLVCTLLHMGDIFDLIYVQRRGGGYGAIYSQFVEIALTGWLDCFAVRRYVYFSGKQSGIGSELLVTRVQPCT